MSCALSQSRAPKEDAPTVLHVANVSRNVQSAHLKEIFGHYGVVTRVDLAYDKRLHLPKV
ncbi:unnamed protein product [Chrysoparadoxa australica]